jgi:hypothetical protein
MRTTRALVAGLALSGLLLPAAVPASAAPSPDLVLRYSFNTDTMAQISDASSNQISGTLLNADPATAFVAGREGSGKALNLIASEKQYVRVSESAALDVKRFTLAAWIRYTGTVTPETRGRWEVLEKAGAYWLNVRTDGRLRAGGFFGGCESSQFWKYADSTATVPTGVWTHVAATYNGTRLVLYLNGVRSGSLSVTGDTCTNDEPLAVGAKDAPAKGILEAFWDGQLDEIRIYSRALRAPRIARLATSDGDPTRWES